VRQLGKVGGVQMILGEVRELVRFTVTNGRVLLPMLVAMFLNAPAGRAQGPCCGITTVDARAGIVTAKVNATGQQFQFTLNNPALLRSLRVAEPVSRSTLWGQASLEISKSIRSSGAWIRSL
jgi:hypothetical protein